MTKSYSERAPRSARKVRPVVIDIQTALGVNRELQARASEKVPVDGATIVRNLNAPDIYDANFVTAITAANPGEVDAMLNAVEREMADLPYRRFDIDPMTPPAVEARLGLEGYRENPVLLMGLEGELAGRAEPHEIRQVESAEDWAALGSLTEADWREGMAKIGGTTAREGARRLIDMYFGIRRAKSSPPRWWLAYLDGAPRAYLSSWEGLDGVGQVEDLFTQPDFRFRGLARALLHHCVADARHHGAGSVILICNPNDTPKNMYAEMGFHPIAMKRWYFKRADS